ncbi:glycine zipper domain-containing protein [Shimia aestuarii]|nr:glycine zipper domain-containing protein [Shimia aestuarii]
MKQPEESRLDFSSISGCLNMPLRPESASETHFPSTPRTSLADDSTIIHGFGGGTLRVSHFQMQMSQIPNQKRLDTSKYQSSKANTSNVKRKNKVKKVGTKTNARKNTVLATLAAALIVALPMTAHADYVAEKAVKGAVAGAAVAEATGGDAAQGAAVGAAVGAVAGVVQKNDFEDRYDHHHNGNHHGKVNKAHGNGHYKKAGKNRR